MMGKSGTKRWHAETNRCEVFSSANSRKAMPFSFPGPADLLKTCLGVGQGAFYEHWRPMKMRGRFLNRLDFLINVHDLPNSDAMAAQSSLPGACWRWLSKSASGQCHRFRS